MTCAISYLGLEYRGDYGLSSTRNQVGGRHGSTEQFHCIDPFYADTTRGKFNWLIEEPGDKLNLEVNHETKNQCARNDSVLFLPDRARSGGHESYL